MNPRNYRSLFLRALALVLFQVWVLNNAYFLHFINPRGYSLLQPMIYPLILLFMPFDTSRTTMLIVGFFLGLVVDVFTLSYGLHIISCVLAANFRNSILHLIDLSPNLLESDNIPTIKILGPYVYTIYCSIFIVLHHFTYFLIQSFTVSSFLYNVVVAFCSSIISIIFIFIWSMLFDRQPTKRK